MMEGLHDGEENQYFDENPKIIPSFEIDVVEIITPYLSHEEIEADVPIDGKTLIELCHQEDAMEKEMQVSQRVQDSSLLEFNLVDNDGQPKTA